MNLLNLGLPQKRLVGKTFKKWGWCESRWCEIYRAYIGAGQSLNYAVPIKNLITTITQHSYFIMG